MVDSIIAFRSGLCLMGKNTVSDLINLLKLHHFTSQSGERKMEQLLNITQSIHVNCFVFLIPVT